MFVMPMSSTPGGMRATISASDRPIRRKLMTMILVTSGVVLVLTCAAFIGYELLTFRRAAVRQLATLGEIIATESTGAVAFDNQRVAAAGDGQCERHPQGRGAGPRSGTADSVVQDRKSVV